MKRCLLVLAVISLYLPVRAQSIPLGEIVTDDRTIRDPLYGLTLRFPAGWIVRGVTRWGDRETTVYFGAPNSANAFITLYYRVYATPSALPGNPEAFLRDEASRKAERRVNGGLVDYANVVDSFAFRTVGGLPALSYSARFTSAGGRTQVEYMVRILSEKGVVAFLLRGPLDELEEARTAFEGMVETVRLP
jgi:hypothetical protein